MSSNGYPSESTAISVSSSSTLSVSASSRPSLANAIFWSNGFLLDVVVVDLDEEMFLEPARWIPVSIGPSIYDLALPGGCLDDTQLA